MSENEQSIFKETQLGVLGDLFFGVSTAKILDFLLIFREFDYSEADISRNAGVSARQIYRALPKLVKLDLVEHTRISGRSKMYKINANAETIQALEKFIYHVVTKKVQDELVNTVAIQSRFDKENTLETIQEEAPELTVE